ncbi:citrulline utilization hydrolase CtlX [Niabella insulamsoli]|uniref:citrulline utilization hydrolase CtlX n=1 Tax=Niabella insulamsoli TaxID=3144874 RepID=UPI0031FBAA65
MTTSNLLMVRPSAFAFNPQTAVNNQFQKIGVTLNVPQKALQEFDDLVDKLQLSGVQVTVVQDTPEPHTPDSIFPNNWVSFHEEGSMVIYPMFAENRRAERYKNVLPVIKDQFSVRSTIDLSEYERKQMFLEGTGSMVLDRDYHLAYACLSPRTSASAFYDFCDAMGYIPVIFDAVDQDNLPIYHTNVMMCMADEYVVVCLDTIRDALQRQMLIDKFNDTGKEIIEISFEQMKNFAANMLQIENRSGDVFLVMSTKAYNTFTREQISLLQSFNPIIHAPLNTIEENGGGGARCMIAEIFLAPL